MSKNLDLECSSAPLKSEKKTISEISLEKHYEWKGKIETKCRVDVSSREALMEAYTPGVAAPCLEIS